MGEPSDLEFVDTLRSATVAYLDAVDRWEVTYRKYYRMPGHELTISSDMKAEQYEYEVRRRGLRALLPRVVRLCRRYDVRNPFPGLLKTELGRHAPQHRTGSAVGRSERNAVGDCLTELADACSSFKPEAEPPVPAGSPRGSFNTRRAILAGGGFGMLAALGIVIAMRWATRPAQPITSPQESKTDGTARPIAPAPPTGAAATTHFYRMEGRPLARWGDYIDILQHGMTAHLERSGNLLSLERTGPYMPAITFPGVGDVVLTAGGRKLLEASRLSGFTFQPVNKTRIVELPWHDWDLTAKEPPEYPSTGEPEDYILERPHNAHVAEEMGEIWELVVPVTAKIGRPRRDVKSFHELYVERSTWNGADVFRGDGYGSPLVTERAKAWIEEYFGGYVLFEEFASR